MIASTPSFDDTFAEQRYARAEEADVMQGSSRIQSNAFPPLPQGNDVFEFAETAELPVVTKSQRIYEEVRIGKEQTERSATAEATLRHTELTYETSDPVVNPGPTK